jgi:hypothetical protein
MQGVSVHMGRFVEQQAQVQCECDDLVCKTRGKSVHFIEMKPFANAIYMSMSKPHVTK